ncbi:MAG: hypothetical protein RIQ64_2225 [Actinomycetota bacterium]
MMTTTEQPAPRPTRERHVARSARILSTGLSATAILGITAAFGAAERAESTVQAATLPPSTAPGAPPASVTSTQSALAPLGSSAPGLAPAPTTTLANAADVGRLPSPVGTITLPAATPNEVAVASADTVVVADTTAIADSAALPGTAAATLPTSPPVTDSVPTTVQTTVQTVAPIAPATPVVELTLPPPPSNGSSGGSR